MRAIERSSAFKRDYKRAKATPRHRENVDSLLSAVLERLISDMVLPESSRDHPLSGDWNGYRECHVKPDLLLIYRKVGKETLRLARLGSHSELFD
ncbi:MAG: type II toxin-antitoxin system YafQ family toxin [Bryobacterales bacterium]|nr:type II toxin-antitoxin system YafQ family toxin [Bryobacterales bacterium]